MSGLRLSAAAPPAGLPERDGTERKGTPPLRQVLARAAGQAGLRRAGGGRRMPPAAERQKISHFDRKVRVCLAVGWSTVDLSTFGACVPEHSVIYCWYPVLLFIRTFLPYSIAASRFTQIT